MTPAMINSTTPQPYSRSTCFELDPSGFATAAGWGVDGIGPTGMGAVLSCTGVLGAAAACEAGGESAAAGVATLIHRKPPTASARNQRPDRGSGQRSTTKA
jgi:hypothetical protein